MHGNGQPITRLGGGQCHRILDCAIYICHPCEVSDDYKVQTILLAKTWIYFIL